ncbi:hypothetical protein PR001_g23703 [Phytophthora rubi]|uniref:Uncharacterized protein n=1 Tax=Phytophthora rubi TaxID=129364 RepID=A0A6A3LV51_9STRA|nr:hypothetical protein PR001_g23703 [Phytophthora rubi]KAE9022090.1 hypothetical protein PR002_g12069 [Phytophthora rubi]
MCWMIASHHFTLQTRAAACSAAPDLATQLLRPRCSNLATTGSTQGRTSCSTSRCRRSDCGSAAAFIGSSSRRASRQTATRPSDDL